MEVKAGYKQTEVGVIPEDWEVKKMSAIVEKFVNGGTPSTAIERYWQGGIPWITGADILDQKVSEIRRFITREAVKNSSTNVIEKGNLLLVSRTGVGKLALAPFDIAISQDFTGVYVRKGPTTAEYLYRYLDFNQPILQSQNQGTSIRGITRDTLAAIQVILPPTIEEQSAIATALSDADALINGLEKLIAKKRNVKQGGMQQLLTGKKRLPGFSGEWEVKRLGDVADTDPENLGAATDPNFAFNYIALEDVDVGRLRSYAEQVFQAAPSRARRKLRKGDVLVSTVRPNLMSHLLFSANGDNWVCSTGFCVVRCRQGVTHPQYVFFHLFAGHVARQIEALLTGSNYPAINRGDVRALEVPFPQYDEQVAIAQVLSDMDAEIESLEAKLAKARMVKQGMMQELLTGRRRLI